MCKYLKTNNILCILCFLTLCAGTPEAELIMRTHGHITLSPYVHGFDNSRQLYRGYRSEFMTNVDYYRLHRVVFTSVLGNTTVITKPESSRMKLDRIRYTLTPGARYEFEHWLIKFALHHECFHMISRPETKGSIWWNSFQLGIGSKESYYLYMRDQYKNKQNTFIHAWDAQMNVGYIMPARNTLFSGQNHEYRYELFSLIRYHLGTFRRWAYFASLRQHYWIKSDNSREHQINITLNLFRRGTVNFAGFFYNYTIYDTFMLDNSDGLGSVGFKILF